MTLMEKCRLRLFQCFSLGSFPVSSPFPRKGILGESESQANESLCDPQRNEKHLGAPGR